MLSTDRVMRVLFKAAVSVMCALTMISVVP